MRKIQPKGKKLKRKAENKEQEVSLVSNSLSTITSKNNNSIYFLEPCILFVEYFCDILYNLWKTGKLCDDSLIKVSPEVLMKSIAALFL